jgi:hypothetical protein
MIPVNASSKKQVSQGLIVVYGVDNVYALSEATAVDCRF